MDDLTAFLTARLAEAWSAARDRELAAGLDESPETRMIDALRTITYDMARTAGGEFIDAGEEVIAAGILRDLAAIWGDHPDYRPEWKS